MAPRGPAYRPSMDPETRERPAALSLARGAPTASCLLLAGRSPGPAARSDAAWFGSLDRRLQRLHRSWTSVLKNDRTRRDEHGFAAYAWPVCPPRAVHPRGPAHGHALVDDQPLDAQARVDVGHQRTGRRAGRRIL